MYRFYGYLSLWSRINIHSVTVIGKLIVLNDYGNDLVLEVLCMSHVLLHVACLCCLNLYSYRNVDYYYSCKEERFRRRSSSKRVAITIVGFWKPPGALQWVEKCVTETVFKEKSPSFAMKVINYLLQLDI